MIHHPQTRRRFLQTLGMGLGGGATAWAFPFRSGSPSPAEGPPNVLFIAVDDLNDWVNCLGGRPGIITPNLDRLAKRGVLFTNAHCSSPACCPSRASLMTGISPTTSGVYDNIQDWRESPALKNAVTIPAYFRSRGYRAVGGGKIFHALSWIWKDYGLDQNDPASWDEYFPSKRRQLPEDYWPNENLRRGDREIIGDPMARGNIGKRPSWFFDWAPVDAPDEAMADSKVVEWAISEVQRKHDRPFFQAVGIFKPHIPWYVPKKYFDLYPLEKVTLPEVRGDWGAGLPPAGRAMGEERRAWHRWVVDNNQWKRAVQGYMAGISFADAQLGRLLDALDASPCARNTVIVLWSDHGFHLGERETWEKFTLWEESTRVTFMVVAPGVTPAGGRCGRPVSLLDIYPTLVELAGGKPAPELEGRSLVPLLRNPQAPSDRAVVTTWLDSHAVRSERWRYIRYADGSEELYDHQADPGESINLAGKKEFLDIKAGLAARLPEVKIPYQHGAPPSGDLFGVEKRVDRR